MRYALLTVAAALMLSPSLAAAQEVPPTVPAAYTGPVAVVVTVPLPAGAPRSVIEAGIQRSVPQYRQVPGLLRKYFTIGDTSFGGVYLFTTRAAAEAWFNAAWHSRIVATYGHDGETVYFDVPVVLDNAEVPTSAQAPR